jgi:hypothetical protein
MVSRVEISKRVVLINTASAALARVINLAVVLWLNAHLLRRISPEEMQLWPLLMSVIVLLPLFTSILTSGIGRFVLAAYATGDDRRVTQIVSTMFLPLLGAAAIIPPEDRSAWHIDKVLVCHETLGWRPMALLIRMTSSRPARRSAWVLRAAKLPCTTYRVAALLRLSFRSAFRGRRVCGWSSPTSPPS